MPSLGIRITHELHGRLHDRANEENISVSDFVRQTVEQALDYDTTLSNNVGQEKFTKHLESQLKEKDQQISQLHQLVAMSQKHSEDLLEDLRKPRSWWHFWQKNGT